MDDIKLLTEFSSALVGGVERRYGTERAATILESWPDETVPVPTALSDLKTQSTTSTKAVTWKATVSARSGLPRTPVGKPNSHLRGQGD